MTQNTKKTIVGNQEWCALPNLGIEGIKARIDSGAKTSSIHAFNIHQFNRGGQSWVRFDVHPIQKNRKVVIHCESPIVDRRVIKSSSGIGETRYVIRSSIEIGGNTWDIELTLANRDSMGFRMLLGREAMNGRIIVDPAMDCALGDRSKAELRSFYGRGEAAKTGLKIGLLASNEKLESNQRIMEAGIERGHQMIFLNAKQCYMKLDALEPEAHYRGGLLLNDLDAVIIRIRRSIEYHGTALARQFESMGILTTNSSNAIIYTRDKLFSLQLMLKNGIDIPTTGFAHSPINTNNLIDMVGGAPLVVKLLDGAGGQGVVLAETNKAAESTINAFKSLGANLLVQRYIQEANGKKLRCLVIDGKVVASIERTAEPGELGAFSQKGKNQVVTNLTNAEQAMATKAVKVMGLQIAAVDIIRSENGPLLLDVKCSPDLAEIENVTGKDIARMVILSVEKQLPWNKELEV